MKFLDKLSLSLVLAAACLPARAATLHVGGGQAYPTLASAIAAAGDGDTVLVSAGTYDNDFAEITHDITLRAQGGMAVLRATGDIANHKAILITDADVSLDGFVFTGARVTNEDGANGAGIRYQGGNLTLRHCWFHHNQEGLLGDALPGRIRILASEFDHNGNATGPGAGRTHNIYAGNNDLLDIEDSYIHHAILGHEIKSRANRTVVRNSRIVDGPGSTASYSIDLPNGGDASVIDTVVEQGPDSVNGGMIAYGEEGDLLRASALTLRGVTFVNDLARHVPSGVALEAPIAATLTDTRVYGLTAAQLGVSGTGQGTFDITGTAWLNARPRISGKHPF